MSLDNALFLVYRRDKLYHVKGSEISTKIRSGDKILVQRGDERFHAWCGQLDPNATPFVSYRLYYFVSMGTGQINPDTGNPTNDHPDGDRLINLSLYYGSAGPYKTNEWRNFRNKQNTILDIDGKTFKIVDNPDIELGDICHITEENGSFEGWYSISTDLNKILKFDVQYYKKEDPNKGRERTDIKTSGPRPPHNGSAILRFDFYRPDDFPFGTIQDDDLILANDDQGDVRRVKGSRFKNLFLPPPFATTKPTIRFTGEYNSYGQLKYELVSPSIWNRPSQTSYGQWGYTRDGSDWYERFDDYGFYWFDPDVLFVRYVDKHKFDGTYLPVSSDEHPIGT